MNTKAKNNLCKHSNKTEWCNNRNIKKMCGVTAKCCIVFPGINYQDCKYYQIRSNNAGNNLNKNFDLNINLYNLKS